MSARLCRRLTLAAIAMGLATVGSLSTAAMAQAATNPAGTTRTVVWFVPSGFADRWAEPQLLRADPVGCGDFQVDVYRYSTESDVAFVDALVATGVLRDSSEDGPVFVSSTDVTSTATCAPPAPAATPTVTATLPSATCIAAGTPADSRTASLVLGNVASTEAVTFTVDTSPVVVAAGDTVTVPMASLPDTGSTISVTAAGRSWSFTLPAITSCPVVAPPRGATQTAGTPAVRVAAAAAAPAAVPAAASVAAAPASTAVPATTAASIDTAAAPSLAFTGSSDTAAGAGLGGGIIALGLGLVLWTRRRRPGLDTVGRDSDTLG